MPRTKILLALTAVFLLAAIFHIAWTSIPQDAWVAQEQPFEVTSSSVIQGTPVEWTARYCRQTNEEYVVRRYIEHIGTQTRVPVDEVENQGGIKEGECHPPEGLRRSAVVPLHSRPGISREVSVFVTDRNGRPLEQEFVTEEFEVLPVDK